MSPMLKLLQEARTLADNDGLHDTASAISYAISVHLRLTQAHQQYELARVRHWQARKINT